MSPNITPCDMKQLAHTLAIEIYKHAPSGFGGDRQEMEKKEEEEEEEEEEEMLEEIVRLSEDKEGDVQDAGLTEDTDDSGVALGGEEEKEEIIEVTSDDRDTVLDDEDDEQLEYIVEDEAWVESL